MVFFADARIFDGSGAPPFRGYAMVHSVDPRSGVVRRHHMFDQTFQRTLKRAVLQSGIDKPATPHTLRHAPYAAPSMRWGSIRPPVTCRWSKAGIWPTGAAPGWKLDRPQPLRSGPLATATLITPTAYLRRMR